MTTGSPAQTQRRRIIPYMIGYVIIATAVVLVAHVAAGPMGWSESALDLLDKIAVLGLPLSAALAWFTGRREETPPEPPAPEEAPAEAAPLPGEPGDHQPSIAVLPFADRTTGEREPFADGLTEEILDVFSDTGRLRVASHASCFAFKGKEVDHDTAARKLGVRYLIAGIAERVDDNLYVEARLREAGVDAPLWQETYETTLDKVFAIQDDIVRHVGDTLDLPISPPARQYATTSDAAAYVSYLCGRGCFIRGKLTDLAHAVRLFSEATEIDPDFVRAWMDLAETYAMQAIYYEGSDAERKAAREASERAVELAPERGRAHASRGLAHLASEEYGDAAREFELAIERDPDIWEVYYNYGRACYHQGRMDDALKLFEQAAAANPGDFQSPLLAAPIYKARGDDEAFEEAARVGVSRAERNLADYPDNHRAYYLGAGALLDLGERERAFEWAEKALAIDPSDPSIRYNMGCFYAKAGEIDKAFDCLKDSITSRSWVLHDPDLEPIRQDPRYQRLLDSLE